MARRLRRSQPPTRRPRSRGFLSDMEFDFPKMDLSFDDMLTPTLLKPYMNDAIFGTLLLTGALAVAGAAMKRTRIST